jgi:hypothetical protein
VKGSLTPPPPAEEAPVPLPQACSPARPTIPSRMLHRGAAEAPTGHMPLTRFRARLRLLTPGTQAVSGFTCRRGPAGRIKCSWGPGGRGARLGAGGGGGRGGWRAPMQLSAYGCEWGGVGGVCLLRCRWAAAAGRVRMQLQNAPDALAARRRVARAARQGHAAGWRRPEGGAARGAGGGCALARRRVIGIGQRRSKGGRAGARRIAPRRWRGAPGGCGGGASPVDEACG